MSRRNRMAPVYVGDVGVIPEPSPTIPMPLGLDTSNLTFRQLCNLALAVGIDIRDIIGVKECYMHVDMIFLGSNEMPDGYNIFEHCTYCKNCWKLFRLKSI